MSIHINTIDSHTSTAQVSNLMLANGTAVQYSNQAVAASSAGDYATAARLHQQAIALKLKAYNDDSTQLAISYNGLGETLLSLEKLEEADVALAKALRVRDDAAFGGLGKGPRFDAGVTRENVAQLREAQGRLDEAKQMRLRGKEGQMCCGHYRVRPFHLVICYR